MAETEAKTVTSPQDTSREGSICTGQQTPQTSEKSKIEHGFIDHLNQDVRTSLFVELQLLLITVCTGIQGRRPPFLYIVFLLLKANVRVLKMQQRSQTITVLPRTKQAIPFFYVWPWLYQN